MKTLIKRLINTELAKRGLVLEQRSAGKGPSAVMGYIPARETISAARAAHLTVSAYLEQLWGNAGQVRRIISQMGEYGVPAVPDPSIVEIGTGAGLYLERLLEVCKPSRYQSYEPSEEWAEWLRDTYPISSCRSDGKMLVETESDSIDVVHAHGVFVYLPLLVSCGYFAEICRVLKVGGFAVFDIMSEDCLARPTLQKWLDSGSLFPAFLSTDYVQSFFSANGFTLLGTFQKRFGVGLTKYLVLKRLTRA